MHYFYVIAFLNLVDLTFTSVGLSLNVIEEGNPIMDFLWQASPYYFILVKGFLSIILVVMALCFPLHFVSKRGWNILLKGTTAIYVFVIGLHFVWVKVIV
ncbi:DUF5658 family protein [Salirhabdus salicampi]|uniref:DUF5658 family protein n=1 Tax=Salirhabdus salicampi TaxID=476102 RepID=UPI0020C28107|nr:DUF5658 family protein [Salirhabdus salicampi]MCP8616186.1 DUF5658 family protein [Salirhabdus salicampi]